MSNVVDVPLQVTEQLTVVSNLCCTTVNQIVLVFERKRKIKKAEWLLFVFHSKKQHIITPVTREWKLGKKQRDRFPVSQTFDRHQSYQRKDTGRPDVWIAHKIRVNIHKLSRAKSNPERHKTMSEV